MIGSARVFNGRPYHRRDPCSPDSDGSARGKNRGAEIDSKNQQRNL